MRTLLFLIFVLSKTLTYACSGMPKSFCLIKNWRPNDCVITGLILAKSSHSLQMQVIDVLRGSESRPVITIWDGTDFNCNGFISMSAGDLGNVGDSIVVVLPLIGAAHENTWDVTGDYRRPYSLFETAWLNIKNGNVNGYVSGAPATPILSLSYPNFKAYWNTPGSDCIALSIKEILPEKINISHDDYFIRVRSASDKQLQARFFALDGRLIREQLIGKDSEIPRSGIPSGVYIISVSSEDNGLFLTQKLLLN